MRPVVVLDLLAASPLVTETLPGWTWVVAAVAVLLGVAAFSRRRRRAAPSEQPIAVAVTARGVSVSRPGAGASRVDWSQLVEVLVLTSSDGPLADDVFLLLRGADGSACLVPSPMGGDLVRRLVRLPGFDHERFIGAMGSTTEAGFRCWAGRPGDALAAAEEPPAEEAGASGHP